MAFRKAAHAMRAPDDRYPRSNVDLVEKHGSEVAGHPHPPVGRGDPAVKVGRQIGQALLRHLTHKRKLPRANLRSPYRPSTGG